MAITVVKEPEKTKFPLAVKCSHCFSDLEIGELKDIRYIPSTNIPSLKVKCPVCTNEFSLSTGLLEDFDILMLKQAYEKKIIESYQNDNLR